MSIKTFKRNEVKYIISKEQFSKILRVLTEYMQPDEFCTKDGSYKIYNVYLDTTDDQLIKKSIEKPFYKEKLRMRSYKIPNFPNDEVLEGDLSEEVLLIVETDLLENKTTLQCLIISEDSRFHKIDNAFPEDPSDPF